MPPTARRKVLIVDDHLDGASTMTQLLQDLGHDATFVTDPRDALRAAKAFAPDIAFLDLGMPHIDGYALARSFRADPELSHVCLVAVTAYGSVEHRRLSREAGFDAHVQKPADVDVLRAIIAQFAEGSPR